MSRLNRVLALTICILFMLHTLCIADSVSSDSSDYSSGSVVTTDSDYKAYLNENSAAAISEDISLTADNISAFTGIVSDNAVKLEEGNSASWNFSLPKKSSAVIEITYIPGDNAITDPEIAVLINGKIPFEAVKQFELCRIWENNTAELNDSGYIADSEGNEISPTQIQADRWNTETLNDTTGTVIKAYRFVFSDGNNTLNITSVRNSVKISKIRLSGGISENKTEIKESDVKDYSGEPIIIEGESAKYKSSSVLMPASDKSSPVTSPSSPYKSLINTIGGSSWNNAGQWIEWIANVEMSGYYSIGFKYRQNTVSGMFSTRMLTVNGSSPFEQAQRLEFGYNSGWKAKKLVGENDEPLKIYLHKGENTIRLTAALGRAAEFYAMGVDSVANLNNAYRQIIMYTSTTPDSLRNYRIDRNCPEAMKIIRDEAENLRKISDGIAEISGQKGDINTSIENLRMQLESFAESPITIPSRIDIFRSNITAYADAIYRLAQQPLEIDYIALSSPEKGEKDGLENIKASFIKKITYEIKAFIASYSSDYSVAEKKSDSITVWTTSGRDQATALKRLIDMQFTKNKGISVDLKMVGNTSGVSTLLLATVSGMGPDVAIGLANTDAVNYAIRDTACNLSEFARFDEITKRFQKGAMIPFSYNGGYYALPLTQGFSVMFYRTDLLAQMGIDVPETWDDLYYAVSELQKHNMTVGIPSDLNYLVTHIYQNGKELYSSDQKTALLDSTASVNAFSKWCNLYTSYNLPIDYDAANRFRTGEMPLLIADYSLYNTISVLAPEIKGFVGMALTPGTLKEDSTVDHTVAANGTCAMILSTSDKKNKAFEFLEWLTSDTVQSEYARNLECRLGIAARIQTANVAVLSNISWTKFEYSVIEKQWKMTKGIPEVPGSYYVSRSVNNALRNVVSYGTDPQEVLKEYTETVNDEITKKRNQYHLN